MKLEKLIANLGYGSRKEVGRMFDALRITNDQGQPISRDTSIEPERIRVDGEPLDPRAPFSLMLHKPTGYTCSLKDRGELIYDLLPVRFRRRAPTLASVGRLDRDTSGLLIMTDDGALLHRIVHPKAKLPKVYEVTLARDMRGDEARIFASGELLLESETTPLKPATLEVIDTRHARLTLIEGRYHQVRRMFAALGNHVDALHRSQIGNLTLSQLEPGKWLPLDAQQLAGLTNSP